MNWIGHIIFSFWFRVFITKLNREGNQTAGKLPLSFTVFTKEKKKKKKTPRQSIRRRTVCVCSVTKPYLTLCDPLRLSPEVPLFMRFSRQEYWSGVPLPSLRDLPDSGIEATSPVSPARAGQFFTTEPPGKPQEEELDVFQLLIPGY